MSDDFVVLSGESPWDAIVNHYSLTIEDENAFREFCEDHGADDDSDEWTLRRLFAEWEDRP